MPFHQYNKKLIDCSMRIANFRQFSRCEYEIDLKAKTVFY
jgi:hypothetical protein